MNTITLQLRYRAPAPARLKLAQANAVRFSCEWADAAALPAAFSLVAEIHSSRTVAPGSTPLAAVLVPNLTSASADPWVIDFSGAQLNLPIPNPPTRRVWMVVYLLTPIAPVTVAAAEIELEYHAISGITPAPPAPAIHLTPEAAAELFASIDDVDTLSDRVTALESQESGGAQADWNAPSGPSAILNKPPLGNAAGRNVGTGAGDVAAGNHTHSSTSQIAGLDTALAAKADLSGGKLPVSQLPDIAVKEYLGAPADQTAMLGLSGQRGDWCTRLDDGKVWIITAEPSSILGNWRAMTYPNAPVLSVAGRTGSITLGIGDIGGLQAVLDVKVNADALFALAFRDTVGSAQIDAGAVTNLALATMAAATLKGSIGGGTPADLTATQVTELLNVFTSALKGLVPASGGGTTTWLRADGSWATPPGGSPAGTGTELQFKSGTEFGAVTGSSVSGANVTLTGSLAINSGSATNGLRLTGAGGFAQIFFYGTGANGFFYTVDTTGVAFRGKSFILQGDGASDACQLIIGVANTVRLRSGGTNNMRLGDVDAASPLPQTISVQSATGTHVSAAAAILSIDGAQGRGTGAGGDVRIRVAPNGSTSGVLNPLVEAVRFRAADLATQCAGAIIAGGPVVFASFTTSTLPSVTLWPRGQIWVSGMPGYPAYSDGTNWRRYSDDSIVSPT
jgi:hypothetical protein